MIYTKNTFFFILLGMILDVASMSIRTMKNAKVIDQISMCVNGKLLLSD